MAQHVGSKFVAIDFHVHTPGSTDYKDKSATASDIVAEALKKGLGGIVITDHNTTCWIDLVRDAAKDSGLIVFPGFEINAQGGHILGIFDPMADIAQIETSLIEAGISKPNFGKENSIGNDITSVFYAIEKNGGICVGAHVDGPKGFLTTIEQGAAKEKYFKDPNLKAIEIVDTDKKDDWVAGKIYNRAIACVQGSDAHSLAGIGTKHTHVKTQHLNLEGLRLAFSEPKLRIQLQHEYEPKKIPFIKSLSVSQGFLSGHKFEFNPGLNCLVGSAGSGKSTILEFLRFGLDQISSLDQVADDVKGKLKDLAGVGCDIIIELVLDAGETVVVKRHFDDLYNSIYVHKMPNGEVLEVDVSDIFPIHAYSQGEAISIARNPLAQLDLIDKHIKDSISQYQDEIKQAYEELNNQVEGIIRLEAKTKDKQSTEAGFNTTKERIKLLNDELTQLEEARKSPVIREHNLWIAEKNYLTSLVKSFAETKQEIEQGMSSISLSSSRISIPQDATPNKTVVDECDNLARQLDTIQEQAKKLMLDKVEAVEKLVRSKASIWKEKYQTHDAEYQSLQMEQRTSRLSEINNELEKLRTRQQELVYKKESIKKAEEALLSTFQRRKTLLASIKDKKERIRVLREKKAKEFVRQIGDTISLKLIADGNKKEYEQLITEIFKGTHARGMSEKISKIEASKLFDLIVNNSVKTIATLAEIDERWASTLVEQVKGQPSFLYQLQTVEIEDLLEIGFRIGHGIYKPLEKLSSGQKATVIVLLTMVEGKYPIIFDQPEDALYTPFIYTEVVKTLREGKDQRQFILATHNSNIAVAGDSDYSIVIDGSSNSTSVEATGGLEDNDTKKLMLLHLEGGREALISRIQKFGIRDQ